MTTEKVSSDNSRSPGKPIAIKVVPIAITTTSSSTEWTGTARINGEVVAFDYDIPTFDTFGETVSVSFNDEDGNEWHVKAGLTTAQHTLEILQRDSAPRRFPYVGTATIQATTASQTVAQDLTANIIVYVKGTAK